MNDNNSRVAEELPDTDSFDWDDFLEGDGLDLLPDLDAIEANENAFIGVKKEECVGGKQEGFDDKQSFDVNEAQAEVASESAGDSADEEGSVGPKMVVSAPVCKVSPLYNTDIEWPQMTDGKTPKPVNSIANMEHLLKLAGVSVNYNTMSRDIEITIPDQEFSKDNYQNCSLIYLRSLCAEVGLPSFSMDEYVKYIAEMNAYNPVKDWIKSAKWDGKSRIDEMMSTVSTKDPELARKLIMRWMLSAVACAFEAEGVSTEGVLVFQGAQGLGKTRWFKMLLGGNNDWGLEGAMLNPGDKDSVMTCVSHWLVELGELDATFRKADIAALKAFLTKSEDRLRRPWDRNDSQFQRRTVFFASVNDKEFLQDETGNRRYWSLEVDGFNFDTNIDMQQLWSEIYEDHYLKGEKWWLTPEERTLLDESNKQFEASDPLQEMFIEHYCTDETTLGALNVNDFDSRTATNILNDFGFDHPTKSQLNQMAKILRSYYGQAKKTKTGRYFSVPKKGKFLAPDRGPEIFDSSNI